MWEQTNNESSKAMKMFDPKDHPIISVSIIIIIGLGLLFGISTILYYALGNDKPDNYRYIDIDGNEGYAQWCNHRENLTCYTNGGYVQVKEFHKN